MGDKGLVEMIVVRVSPYLREDRPLLWLAEKGPEVPRLLPIAIGEFEAAAIQMPLEGEEPIRPIAYDLLTAMLERLGVSVNRVVVERVKKSVFYARVFVRRQPEDGSAPGAGPSRGIDARPSDAVALALRTGAPIFVSRELLDEVGMEPAGPEGDVEHSVERFQEMEPQITPPPAMAGPGRDGEEADAGPAPVAESPAAAEAPVSELSQLEDRLQHAVICEEYEEAARLRDEIESLRDRAPSA